MEEGIKTHPERVDKSGAGEAKIKLLSINGGAYGDSGQFMRLEYHHLMIWIHHAEWRTV